MFEYIFLIIMILFCSIFIFLGVWMIKTINSKVKKCTLKIVGQVIDYKKEQRYDNDSSRGHFYYVYKPVVQCYIAGEDVIRTLNSGQCSSDSEYPSEICRFGEEIEMFFNPNDYDDYYTPGEKTIKPIGIVMICAGVLGIFFICIFSAIIMFL